jgi:hypothetical protein
MDRSAQFQETAKCQVAFIEFIVEPVAKLVYQVLPKVEPVLGENLRQNLGFWKLKLAKGSTLFRHKKEQHHHRPGPSPVEQFTVVTAK